MRRANIIRIAVLAVVFAGAFLILRSAASTGKSNSCKESKESLEECCKKKNAGEADKMIWETLSQQFFSSI